MPLILPCRFSPNSLRSLQPILGICSLFWGGEAAGNWPGSGNILLAGCEITLCLNRACLPAQLCLLFLAKNNLKTLSSSSTARHRTFCTKLSPLSRIVLAATASVYFLTELCKLSSVFKVWPR